MSTASTQPSRWCTTCGTRRKITDEHAEGHYETGREVGYMVTELDCGHHEQSDPRDLGPAPGAPYAGTGGLPVVASTRPADLAKPVPYADPFYVQDPA